MRKPFVTACLVAVWLSIVSGIAFALPPVQRTVLDNGLVLLVSEEHSLPFVTMYLMVKTGSKDDPAGREGLADLTAASLLFGAAGRTLQQINEEIDFMGARLNSAAGKDYTAVTLRALTKDLDRSVSIFMDAVMKPTFPENEIKKEISRTLGAIQSSEDQPGYVAERAFQKALYLDGPYGHPAEGTKESVGKLTPRMVKQFHQDYYHPNNSILVVVGDVSQQELSRSIVKRLEMWPRKAIPESKALFSAAQKKQVIKVGKPVTQSNIIIGNRGMSRDNPDYYAATVMNHIFGGGGLTSRLMQEIRNKRGLAYSAASFFEARKYGGSFQIHLQTKLPSTDEAIKVAMEDLVRIRTELVSPEELEDAKKYLVGNFPQKLSTQSRIASFFGQVEYFGLGLDYPARYPSLINSISREDIRRVAQTYLQPDASITVIVTRLKEAEDEKVK
ncbi:MAG: Peptidase M16 inactive domain protein [Syntrophorhabdaceae bacterium PtaU1.Bin034]|nr:MAG: Peptidase M16 inactive domain protein [Syntrophorhabdaceae bacterium PtaU1.Bin034]